MRKYKIENKNLCSCFLIFLFSNFLIACLSLVGCTQPLVVKYDAKFGAPPISLKEPLNVFIIPYTDERNVQSKKIGNITSPVFGIDSPELVLAKEPAEIVTNAFKGQLALAGFKAKIADNTAQFPDADIVIEGTVKSFKLDIGPKDTIEIEIETTAKDAKTGTILWEGKAVEKDSRFAGVMGNTRETVSKYISSSLAKVVKETLTEIAAAIEKTRPHSLEPVKEEIILGNEGRLALNTVPPQVQIYIDDVYYGQSPITIELAPGIYTVYFKLTGFKSVAQKIAVRKGRVAEFSIILEKE